MTETEIDLMAAEALREEMKLPRMWENMRVKDAVIAFFLRGFRAGLSALQRRQAEQAAAGFEAYMETLPPILPEFAWCVPLLKRCWQAATQAAEARNAEEWEFHRAEFNRLVATVQQLEAERDRAAARVAEFRRRLDEYHREDCHHGDDYNDGRLEAINFFRKILDESFAAERPGE